ncbi:MAG TPA: MBL fold metallo-hydrolase [Streptosporangiaceae bacterium]|nr:MBL fold metallo-hydrolase [Streptosporangiaceae bacterium]
MRLTVVGCSGSIPSPHSAASCYLLEVEGFRLVVDLGSGAFGPLQRYAAVNQVDAVALSHLHADHFIDMCSFWVARKYSSGEPLPRLPVYGPAEAARRVSLANDDPDVTGIYDFVALAPGRRQIGPFTVTVDRVAHPVETFAYRFEYGGRSLVYSGDTGPCPALTELARSADVLLCEAGFPELPDLLPDLHLCGSQAGQHAAAAGAGRLVLTHLDPDEDPAQNLAGAQDAFPGPVTLAAPGQVIDLDR